MIKNGSLLVPFLLALVYTALRQLGKEELLRCSFRPYGRDTLEQSYASIISHKRPHRRHPAELAR